ncbi:asparagine synthetase B family protein [Capilliphycus salinus ALCB114379]|uniref:asparagine synthetase B family protein n=1 Tax=Capilliphycus salinus TaxID=2768948 RepID=UPI0039A6CC45
MNNPDCSSHHFLGYWSLKPEHQLSVRLNRIVQEKPHLYPSSRPTPSNVNWDVRYTGIKDNFTHRTGDFIAGISVSGLANAEAWVRVEANHLILGREPFGRVPLYWISIEEAIWFSTQIKLLIPLIESPRVNWAGLYGYTCFSYIPTPLTSVDQIFAVPAGCELIFPPDKSIDNPHKYIIKNPYQWQEKKPKIREEREAILQLRTLLKNAIHRQIENLPSEPVGVFLSGGIDSATVAALLVQCGIKVRAYTLDFGEKDLSEIPHAEQVAKFLNIPLIKVSATPDRIKKSLVETVRALDIPFGDGVTAPLYLLNQAARQDVSIVFNGEGGDQLFAGWTNKPMIAALTYGGFNPSFSENKVDFTRQYLQTFHRLYGCEGQVFSPSVRAKIEEINPDFWLQDALKLEYCSELLHRLRRASLMLKGAQNIHPRATNLALNQGLNLRSPFCDLPLAEWTFQLPGEFYLQGSCEKYILKRAVEDWLPPEIVWREKRGMGVPLTLWCVNQLWSEVGYWLNSGVLQAEGRFIPDLAMRVIRGNLGGYMRGRRIGEILWLLMIWQIWRTTVLGESATNRSQIHPFLLPYWWWKWRFQSQEET